MSCAPNDKGGPGNAMQSMTGMKGSKQAKHARKTITKSTTLSVREIMDSD